MFNAKELDRIDNQSSETNSIKRKQDIEYNLM
jgi:hypothetical protein